MRNNNVASAVAIAGSIMVGGCAGLEFFQAPPPFHEVLIKNPASMVETTCYQPTTTYERITTTDAHFQLAGQLDASLKKNPAANIDVEVKPNFSVISTTGVEKQSIAEADKRIADNLFQWCKLNAEGKITNQEYVEALKQLTASFAGVKMSPSQHAYAGSYRGQFVLSSKTFEIPPDLKIGSADLSIDQYGTVHGTVESITLANPTKKQPLPVRGVIDPKGTFSGTYGLPSGYYALRGDLSWAEPDNKLSGRIAVDPNMGEADVALTKK